MCFVLMTFQLAKMSKSVCLDAKSICLNLAVLANHRSELFLMALCTNKERVLEHLFGIRTLSGIPGQALQDDVFEFVRPTV